MGFAQATPTADKFAADLCLVRGTQLTNWQLEALWSKLLAEAALPLVR